MARPINDNSIVLGWLSEVAPSGFSGFFMELAKQGYSSIILFLESVMSVLEMSLREMCSLLYLSPSAIKPAFAWVATVWNAIIDGAIWLLETVFTTLFGSLGFSFDLPFWKLLLSCMGIFLVVTLIVNLAKSVI